MSVNWNTWGEKCLNCTAVSLIYMLVGARSGICEGFISCVIISPWIASQIYHQSNNTPSCYTWNVTFVRNVNYSYCFSNIQQFGMHSVYTLLTTGDFKDMKGCNFFEDYMLGWLAVTQISKYYFDACCCNNPVFWKPDRWVDIIVYP